MILCMKSTDVSLEDLLNEVEGAILASSTDAVLSAAHAGGGLQQTVVNSKTQEWKRPPPFLHKPFLDGSSLPKRKLCAWEEPKSVNAMVESGDARCATATGIALAEACLPSTTTGLGQASTRVGDHQIANDADEIDEVDELLRVVSGVEEGSLVTPALQHTVASRQGGASSMSTRAAAMMPVDRDDLTGFDQTEGANGINGGNEAEKKRRCGVVYLAGSAVKRGFAASSMSQRACDKLRCTDCNFEASFFLGKAWEADTDYMFLRNNAPDRTKLSAKLQPSPDICAYACQCSWINAVELSSLPPTGRPPWACCGH